VSDQHWQQRTVEASAALTEALEQVKRVEGERDEARSRWDYWHGEALGLLTAVTTTQRALGDVKAMREDLADEIESLQSELSAIRASLQRVEQERGSARDQCADAERFANSQEQRAMKAEQERDEAIRLRSTLHADVVLASDYVEAQQEIAALRASNTGLNAMTDRYMAKTSHRMGVLTYERDTARAALAEKDEMIRQQAATIAGLQREYSWQATHRHDAEARLTEAEATIAALRASLTQQEQELSEREAERAQHTAAIEAIRSSLQRVEGERDEARSRWDYWHGEALGLLTAVTTTQRALGDVKAMREDLADEIERLQSELSAIRASLQRVEQERDTAKGQYEYMVGCHAEAIAKLEDRRLFLQRVEQENGTLREDVDRTRRMLVWNVDRAKRLNASLTQQKQENERLRIALTALRIDANRLCDRQLGGTYEDDCRRSIRQADAALSSPTQEPTP